MIIKQIPANTNNYSKGRGTNKVELIIVHWIVGTLEVADKTFQNPNSKVSAHYGVGGNNIHQYVSESDTAWHAGNLSINKKSIGIEHEGGPNLPISEDTYKTSASLIKDICQRYNIPIDRTHIKGHKEIVPTQCPGTLDIDKIINLIISNMEVITDEQKRILEFLSGKTEGDVRQAFGALNDLQEKDKQIATLSQKVIELDNFTRKLEEKIDILSSEVTSSNKIISDWQEQAKTAKEQAGNAIAQITQANEEKNKYRRLYETQLDKSVEKMTVREIWTLLINKIFKNDKQ